MIPKCVMFIILLTRLSLQLDFKIIKTSSGTDRPAPCATICVGETGTDLKLEKYHDTVVEYYKVYIDITKCGFVEKPIVSTSLEGTVTLISRWTHGVFNPDKRGFTVYFTQNERHIQTYSSWDLNVMWSAFGYTC